ncbi:unnamed protein product [Anisakis simplex]|uniref:Transmembrane protein n=1 Tax=Anisakis simplex TaxID=6269 RepID=A0A0M3KJB9_ANISI|nr:unnamed protein product [Anisakis simplex]
MFYVIVIFVEQLTQIWPLLMLAIVTVVTYLASAQQLKRRQVQAEQAEDSADVDESNKVDSKRHSSRLNSLPLLPVELPSSSQSPHRSPLHDRYRLSRLSLPLNRPPPPPYERFPHFQAIPSHPPVSVIDYSDGRNLLNKKEAPPSAIKESSESSQTIDEQDGDKGNMSSAFDMAN